MRSRREIINLEPLRSTASEPICICVEGRGFVSRQYSLTVSRYGGTNICFIQRLNIQRTTGSLASGYLLSRHVTLVNRKDLPERSSYFKIAGKSKPFTLSIITRLGHEVIAHWDPAAPGQAKRCLWGVYKRIENASHIIEPSI